MIFSQIRDRARSESGFSLVELLVVILIIGILATLALPRFLGQRDSANNSKPKTTVRSAITAAEAFYAEGQSYASFDTAALQKYEPALSVSATSPASCTTGNCAKGAGDPNVIYVGSAGAVTGTTAASVTAAGSTASSLVACSNGKGSEAYCIRLDPSGATTYGNGATVGAAYTDALTTTNTQGF